MRRATTVSLACAVLGLAACADKVLPTGPAGRVVLRAAIGAQQGGTAQSADIIVSYARVNLVPVRLDSVRVTLTSGPQVVSIRLSLDDCLSDNSRVPGTTGCPLLVRVRALDGGGAAVDSIAVGPVDAGSAPSIPLNLSMDATLPSIVAMGDTLRAPKPEGVSTATFTSSDVAIATVDQAGLVTGRMVGLVTITATGNGRTSATRVQVSPAPARAISTGDNMTCALDATGAAWCWGANAFGQLGNGTQTPSSVPVKVSGNLRFLEISAGPNNACGLTTAAALYCWGANQFGAVGNPSAGTSIAVPIGVSSPLSWRSVTLNGGASGACALSVNDAAYCWGVNPGNRLGVVDSLATQIMVPTPVQGALAFRTLSMGTQQICGLTTTSVAYCWGLNSQGAVGDGTTTNATAPTPVAGGVTFASISAGGLYTCALTPTGVPYCWGVGGFGANGTTLVAGTFGFANANALVPTAVQTSLTFLSLRASSTNFTFEKSTCGLTATEAYCWGSNLNGTLATLAPTVTCGTSTQTWPCTNTPSRVELAAPIAALVSGGGQACALTKAHALYCWGKNDNGQVGDGTTTNRSLPVLITGFRAP